MLTYLITVILSLALTVVLNPNRNFDLNNNLNITSNPITLYPDLAVK